MKLEEHIIKRIINIIKIDNFELFVNINTKYLNINIINI